MVTVIAYKDGVLAADTASWHGEIKLPEAATKIHRFRDGSLFAATGWRAVIIEVVKWLDRQSKKPELVDEKDFSGIIITPAAVIKHVMLIRLTHTSPKY